MITINPRALAIARGLDEERRKTGLRSPLHGIPIAIKDNIDVSDVPSAGGSLALAGTYPSRDATVVARLRAAGAIIFLKTNDEFALGSQGLSSLGGQTLNPFDLSRNPGGSSGGTGVAVNVGFATVGLATDGLAGDPVHLRTGDVEARAAAGRIHKPGIRSAAPPCLAGDYRVADSDT